MVNERKSDTLKLNTSIKIPKFLPIIAYCYNTKESKSQKFLSIAYVTLYKIGLGSTINYGQYKLVIWVCSKWLQDMKFGAWDVTGPLAYQTLFPVPPLRHRLHSHIILYLCV